MIVHLVKEIYYKIYLRWNDVCPLHLEKLDEKDKKCFYCDSEKRFKETKKKNKRDTKIGIAIRFLESLKYPNQKPNNDDFNL